MAAQLRSMPAGGKVARKPEPAEENQTLFVANIDQKVPSGELKDLLYELFVPYGRIMDIVVSKKR